MKFEVYTRESDDYFVVEGDTIEELQVKANDEIEKREWKNCWSREIKGGEMKSYEVSITIIGIEAENKEDAIRYFWERVDNTDYPFMPIVREEK